MSSIHGTVPEHLKTSMVVPIYKQGDTSNHENYRPVSLLPIISKILERYIFEKLCTFLYISDNQWGFQAGKSSTGAVLSAVHDWQYHSGRGDEVQAIFFDLQKAFDTVPHAKLISKLADLDISPHFLSWISSYLKQQVVVSGTMSPSINVVSGVPQGSVLGTLLFLVYVDGLADMPLHDGHLMVFADDALLYKAICSSNDLQDLQMNVDVFTKWIDEHDLRLNVKSANHCCYEEDRSHSVPTPSESMTIL